jgi:hypothetical protein
VQGATSGAVSAGCPQRISSLCDTYLPGLAAWAVRGLSFTEAQQITPYRLSPWGQEVPAVANWINFVLIKS